MAITPAARARVELANRIGDDWRDLADLLNIPKAVQRGFERGREAADLLARVEQCGAWSELAEALTDVNVNRGDLIPLVRQVTPPEGVAAGARGAGLRRRILWAVATLAAASAGSIAINALAVVDVSALASSRAPSGGASELAILSPAESVPVKEWEEATVSMVAPPEYTLVVMVRARPVADDKGKWYVVGCGRDDNRPGRSACGGVRFGLTGQPGHFQLVALLLPKAKAGALLATPLTPYTGTLADLRATSQSRVYEYVR